MGVVISTGGPGITNLVTPMLDAQTDGVPLLVLSGQVGTDFLGSGAFQEAPACEITRPVTKMSYCIKDVDIIPHMMDYAINLIHEGRPGVVHLDLPKNVLVDTYIQKDEENTSSPIDQDDFREEQLIRAADAINRSMNPIFFLGKGCSPNIIDLVEKLEFHLLQQFIPRALLQRTIIYLYNGVECMGLLRQISHFNKRIVL